MRLCPLTGTMRCKLCSSPFGSPSLPLSLPAHTKSQRSTGQGSASHGVHSGGSKWRCLSWGRPCQQRWGLETWFSHPVPASGRDHQSITDSSPSHHSPSCPCHVASGDDSVPVWLWLLWWPHAQAAQPDHLLSGALALGGQTAHCPLSPPWPGKRSGTHRGSHAITPKPSGPSETWGGPAMGLFPSCLQTGQVPSSSIGVRGQALQHEHRPWGHMWGWLCSLGNAWAVYPSSAVCPRAALTQGFSASPASSYTTGARCCLSAHPPVPLVPPPLPPPHQPAGLSICRPPNPAGTRATHRSPALLGKPLRFDSDNLKLRGGSLQGEAGR